MKKRSFKAGLLAATTLFAGAVGIGHGIARDTAPMAPLEVHAVAAEAVHGDEKASLPAGQAVRKAGLIAAAIASLAGLVHLIGAGNIFRAARKGAQTAGRAAVKAGAYTARAIGKTVASPMRFLGITAGLALFAFGGIWVFDLEWTAGIIIGAAMMGVLTYGMLKARAALAPARIQAQTTQKEHSSN